MTRLGFLAPLLFATVISSSAYGQTMNRCVQGNEVILQNRPCNAPVQPIADNGTSYGTKPRQTSAFGSLQGSWQGEAQFQASTEGNIIPEAHTVSRINLIIEESGKVTGRSANGCKLLGMVNPGVSPAEVRLDVTLSGCRHPALDGRTMGYITFDFRQKSARMALNGLSYSMAGMPVRVDVSSLLRKE